MKTKQLFIGIVTACLSLGFASAALADDGKTFPGSMCQASGSAQDLYYSGASVANRNDVTRSADCPIVRDNVNAAATWIEIEVRDRHASQEIVCTARSLDTDGSSGGWQQTLSTTGTGFQTLSFSPSAAAAWGVYVVSCSLPPMTDLTPSYISSYRILEP